MYDKALADEIRRFNILARGKDIVYHHGPHKTRILHASHQFPGHWEEIRLDCQDARTGEPFVWVVANARTWQKLLKAAGTYRHALFFRKTALEIANLRTIKEAA